MGIFKKHDELFELMARRKAAAAGRPTTEEPGGATPPTTSSHVTRRPGLLSTGVQRPRSTSGFGPRSVMGKDEPELFDVDGDALIVVEDGWTLGDDVPAEAGVGGGLTIRRDTLTVGACLVGGLLLASFLLGRSSTNPERNGVELAVDVGAVDPAPAADDDDDDAPAAPAPQPMALLPTAVTGGPAPAAPVAGSFRPAQTTSPANAGARVQATSVPASAPAAATPAPAAAPVPEGDYVLVVCTTTPANAEQLAKWLNTAPRSPIFGRAGLEAYATRKGVVRIRGFQQREQDVLGQVKATADPLGGSGTFHTAYFKRS